MPFQELDNKLNELQNEVGKVKSASEHIEEAKKAAQAVTVAAEKLTGEFRQHLTNVTGEVDKILKPHKELIDATTKLTETINSIDFPKRLEQQEKELRLVKFIAIGIAAISLIGTILILILK